jgi:hypothetical protein
MEGGSRWMLYSQALQMARKVGVMYTTSVLGGGMANRARRQAGLPGKGAALDGPKEGPTFNLTLCCCCGHRGQVVLWWGILYIAGH